jgi:hypothetical protein
MVVGEADSSAALRNDSQKGKVNGNGKRRSRSLRDDSQKGKRNSKSKGESKN